MYRWVRIASGLFLLLMRRYARPIEALSGIALIAIGTLLYTNKMFYVSIWAQRLFSRFGLDLWRYF